MGRTNHHDYFGKFYFNWPTLTATIASLQFRFRLYGMQVCTANMMGSLFHALWKLFIIVLLAKTDFLLQKHTHEWGWWELCNRQWMKYMWEGCQNHSSFPRKICYAYILWVECPRKYLWLQLFDLKKEKKSLRHEDWGRKSRLRESIGYFCCCLLVGGSGGECIQNNGEDMSCSLRLPFGRACIFTFKKGPYEWPLRGCKVCERVYFFNVLVFSSRQDNS